MTTVAVLGTGAMGAPIARRLLETSSVTALTVWNRTAARTRPLVQAGARAAPTPAEAVTGADVVLTMLADGPAVRSVLAAAAPGLRPGACVVEMSTIGPAAVAELADLLPGVDLVDAPVAGSADAAAAGQLRLFVGGPAAAVDRVVPVLSALGSVDRRGELGTGAALKLVLNTALGTAATALADALAVADAVGVEREAALSALESGALGVAASRLRRGGSFAIALAAKDLDLALAALGDRPAPVARAAVSALRAAPDQRADLSAVIR
jgi:3-hydroxyisobutyrate dehydrogenase-like beta-hydroxyacid dehydrogenase